MTAEETQSETEHSRVDNVQEFASDHPYVAFGGLMVPVTYGITGDPMIALFTGGIVAFGPAIAEGFSELQDDEKDDSGGNGE